MSEIRLEEYNGFLVDNSVTIAHPNCDRWQSLGGVNSAKIRSPLSRLPLLKVRALTVKKARYRTV